MPASNLTCPHCTYEAPMHFFESVNGIKLRCRRCRSEFDNPNIYFRDYTYADCDFRKPVYRFPFFLNGKKTVIKVRDGYVALIISHDGNDRWLIPGEYQITDMTDGFQLYYICLEPEIVWGTKNLDDFGSYGIATLSVSKEFVEAFYKKEGSIHRLEDYLKELVDWCMTSFVQKEVAKGNAINLEKRTYYQRMRMPGKLTDSINLIRIEPGGYRNADERVGFFSSFSMAEPVKGKEENRPEIHLPVESVVPIPRDGYTVRHGNEDVLITATGKAERYKADDQVEARQLLNVQKLYRFRSKQFEFPYGWGIFDCPLTLDEFFAANGTIAFYVDSTESMSNFLKQTKNWRDFEEQFFAGAVKPEMSRAIGLVLNEYIGAKGMDPSNIRNHLSAMSIDLTNVLSESSKFSKYGLRVYRTDIMALDLYYSRRQ